MSQGESCLFCRIVAGDVPADKVFENSQVTAFHDINPVAPVHILIIPNKHISTLSDIKEGDRELMGDIHLAVKHVANEMGLDERGYRVIVNVGDDGGQTVSHVHFHLIGGRSLQWPPG